MFHLKHILTILVQEWQLQVPNGYIQLVFASFDIEADSSCTYDWVEVVSYGSHYYDGSYSQRFCGSSIPGPFTSDGRSMTVRMHTDSSVSGTGFRALW